MIDNQRGVILTIIRIMQRKQINIEELEPLLEGDFYKHGLTSYVRENGWGGISPLPVIEIPEEFRLNGVRYCFSDGNGRYTAAIRTGKKVLDCIVYDETDDFEEVSLKTGKGFLGAYESHIVCLEERAKQHLRAKLVGALAKRVDYNEGDTEK